MTHLKKIAAFTGAMMVVTVLIKPIGLVKDMLVAATFGITRELGIYFLLVSIASFFSSLMSSVYQGSVTPTYVKLLESRQRAKAYSFALAGALTYILVGALISLMFFFFIEKIVLCFAPGLDEATGIPLIFEAKAIFITLLACMFMNELAANLLEAEKRFLTPRLSQSLISLSLITALLFQKEGHWLVLFYGLSAGYALSAFSQIMVYSLSLKGTGAFDFRFGGTQLSAIMPLWPPLFIGSLVAGSSGIVDRMMISLLGEHQFAIFGFADTLVVNINGIMLASLSAAVLPIFSAISCERKGELAQALGDTFRFALAALIPLVLLVCLYSEVFVSLIYRHGHFDSTDAGHVAAVLRVLVVSLLPFCGVLLCARTYNVLMDARTTMFAAVLSAALNLGLDYLLMWEYGVAGIALATVITHFTTLSFFVLILVIRHNFIWSKRDIKGVFVLIFSGVLIGVISAEGKKFGLVPSAIIFLVSYCVFIWMLRIDEYFQVMQAIGRRLRPLLKV